MIWMAIQVVFIDDATERRDVHEIIGIDRDRLCPAGLGLSLAEAKEITAGIQRVLTDVQVAEWQADQRACPACRNRRSLKGHHPIGAHLDPFAGQPKRSEWRPEHASEPG